MMPRRPAGLVPGVVLAAEFEHLSMKHQSKGYIFE